MTKFRRQRLSALSMLLSSTTSFSFAAEAQSGINTVSIASTRKRPCMCRLPVGPISFLLAGVINRVIRAGQAAAGPARQGEIGIIPISEHVFVRAGSDAVGCLA